MRLLEVHLVLLLALPTIGWSAPNPESLQVKVEQYLSTGDLKKAGEALHRLEKVSDPEDPQLLSLRADYYRLKGDLPMTMEIYRGIIKGSVLPEEKSDIFLKIAGLYSQIGDTDKEEDALKAALKESPLEPKIHYALGKFYFVIRHESRTAVRYFREYLKRSGDTEQARELRKHVEQLVAEIDGKDNIQPMPWEERY